jgi:PHD/YefM family antitoxin component YafN of YafNO toxin-antitoxin module
VLIEKHGRGVVKVISVKEYERLTVWPENLQKGTRRAMETARQ